ncbi:MAG: LapA family protein [Pseudomonadota bacterium]
MSSLRRIITLLVIAGIAVATGVFASVNTDVIRVDFLFRVYDLPQSLVIIGAIVVGTLVGLLCASLVMFRLVRERRRAVKQLRVAESEISSLRSLPLQNAE